MPQPDSARRPSSTVPSASVPPSGLTIRPATAADAPDVARINIDSWRAVYAGLMPEHVLALLDADEITKRNLEWLATTDWPRRGLLIAQLGDEVAGYAWLGPSRDHDAGEWVGEVSAIYLAPRLWRQGIGTHLLAAAQDSLRAAGFRSATLWVLTSNVSARRFYERVGWAPDGATKTDEWQGTELHETRYAIELASSGSIATSTLT